MDDARARRLIRQHAETARLLGVDCVPVFRRGGGAEGAGISEGVAGEVMVHEAVTDQAKVAAKASRAIVDVPPSISAAPAKSVSVAPSRPAAASPANPAAKPVALFNEPAPAPSGPKSTDRVAAQKALDALRARYEADAPHKQFVTAHTNIVFGEGDPCARIMFIGEAPGEEEDRTGRPFVGRSGELLNKMITAMGLSRETIYIANVLKTRPPNNATPTARECELCKPYLLEQVQIISPEAIVTLGLPASRVILQSQESMTRLRGTWASIRLPDGRNIPVMPTYHPAFILRSYTPENRAKVWSDLQQVLKKLGMPLGAKSATGE